MKQLTMTHRWSFFILFKKTASRVVTINHLNFHVNLILLLLLLLLLHKHERTQNACTHTPACWTEQLE
ncbi:hypothetical protein T4E_11866 [Trichinella pseudospiralis]|uniref:Uncharacterized protein n=1 Tax=Trichinella pseudospiralis TaxID=6337 RepID=A0A0V0Y076_TRIPS|nr:hypothetical protein T4E_11866 [Trichinella pseudospiralis]